MGIKRLSRAHARARTRRGVRELGRVWTTWDTGHGTRRDERNEMGLLNKVIDRYSPPDVIGAATPDPAPAAPAPAPPADAPASAPTHCPACGSHSLWLSVYRDDVRRCTTCEPPPAARLVATYLVEGRPIADGQPLADRQARLGATGSAAGSGSAATAAPEAPADDDPDNLELALARIPLWQQVDPWSPETLDRLGFALAEDFLGYPAVVERPRLRWAWKSPAELAAIDAAKAARTAAVAN